MKHAQEGNQNSVLFRPTAVCTALHDFNARPRIDKVIKSQMMPKDMLNAGPGMIGESIRRLQRNVDYQNVCIFQTILNKSGTNIYIMEMKHGIFQWEHTS